MKALAILLLIFIPLLSWAQKADFNELGRSLANYQACSNVAETINDELMFDYYQKMFNDTVLSVLSINKKRVKQIYSAWDKSEVILLNLEAQSLKMICLSRFDELSRKLL